MKLRHIVLLTLVTIIATACNFSLAEDVTPPPGYVPPTPVPTLVLVPPQTPNIENGKAIFAEKCAACHGTTGLGDGPQGIQLGVTVPAFGLPEIARPAVLVDWFTTVTRGRMDRFMPPFNSLTDQQRWDVVAYAMSLHTTEDQVAKGKQVFETNCADCSTDFFKDQKKMSTLSEVDLARIVKQGSDSVPAFGAKLSDDDLWAVAAYLRTLAFDTSPALAEAPAASATPETVSGTEPSVTPEAGTPAAEGTPSTDTTPAGIEQTATTNEPTTVAKPGFGTVSGTVDNKSGTELASPLKITLVAYEHGSDPNAGPAQISSQEGTVNPDGTYRFDNVEMPENRIFVAEVQVEGIKMQSGYGIVEAGASSLTLPPITLYGTTKDTSGLVMDEVRLFLDYSGSDVQIFGVYSFHNPTDKTVLVELKDGKEIPFIKNPEGTTGQGYEALQDSQPLMNTDQGLGIPPSENSYGLISFTSVPKQEKFEVAQPFVLPVNSLTVFLPEGTTAKSTALTDEGLQNIQNFNFQVYTALNIPAGATIKFTVSGEPKESSDTATTPQTTSKNKYILFGVSALGLALIAAGGWLYLRDRNRVVEEVEEGEEAFESSEDVLDAIVALDDLHRAKKISDEAYRKRRGELKDILKGMV
ncbi:MAG TPA: c-type cytochrome [Anaerolineales bacterium]|nr:c-type cytochrome [Anaerolineales bacterium]